MGHYAPRVSSLAETFYNILCPTSHPIWHPILAWRPIKAPSLAELEVLASEIFRRLPRRFRDLCEGVVIQVDDFATDEALDQVGTENEFDCSACFTASVCLSARKARRCKCRTSCVRTGGRSSTTGPNMTKRSARLSNVLVHEIGHHFGLSNTDMMAIEATADEEKGAVS